MRAPLVQNKSEAQKGDNGVRVSAGLSTVEGDALNGKANPNKSATLNESSNPKSGLGKVSGLDKGEGSVSKENNEAGRSNGHLKKAEEAPLESARMEESAAKTNSKPPSDFASLFRGKRSMDRTEELTFFPEMTKGKLQITKDDMETAGKEWQATLIGAAIGEGINYHTVRRYVEANWFVPSPTIYQKDCGVFIFKFQNGDDRDKVMDMGKWYLDGSRLLVLKRWEPGMPTNWDFFERIPTWACFPDIDPMMCNNLMLSKLGSTVGIPQCMDEITATCSRLSYARILIEVNPVEAQIREVEVTTYDNKIYKQKVNFEWLPWTCSGCNSFGHSIERCPQMIQSRKTVKRWEWRPKMGTSDGVKKGENTVDGKQPAKTVKLRQKEQNQPTEATVAVDQLANLDINLASASSTVEVVSPVQSGTNSDEVLLMEEGWSQMGRKKMGKSKQQVSLSEVQLNVSSRYNCIRRKGKKTMKQLMLDERSEEALDGSDGGESDDETYVPKGGGRKKGVSHD